jgi:hypothetical protein
MPEWLEQAWVGISGWLLFVFALAKAIQATYAAERDRKALASAKAEREKLGLEIDHIRRTLESADLQREKLALEVQLLKNSPEVVADRRAIYDRLRELIVRILETAAPTLEQVRAMYAVVHDSEFAFPRELSSKLVVLNRAVFELYWSNKMLTQPPRGTSEPQRQLFIADNHGALNDVIAFQTDMVETFRPYLNRAG